MLARTLGVYQVGIYYALMVLPNFIVKIGTLGLGPSLIFHIGKEKFHISVIIRSVYKIFSISSLLAVISLLIVFHFLDNPAYSIYYVVILLVFVPLQFLRYLNNRILLATMQIKKSNNLRVIPQILNLLCLLFFYLTGELGVLEALLSILFATFVINIIYYFLLIKKIDFTTKAASQKCMFSLIRYGFLYAIASIVMKFHMEFDVILLERLSSFEEVGLYKMGTNFTRLLKNAPMVMSLLIFLRAAHSRNIQKSVQNSLKYFRVVFVMAFLSAGVLFFLAPFFVPLLYGAAFQPSVHIMRIILPGAVIMTALSALSSQMAGSGKPLYLFYSFLPALVINIGLNILWIPSYGGAGAAWASNVSCFSGALIYYIIFTRHYKVPFLHILKFSLKDINVFKLKE